MLETFLHQNIAKYWKRFYAKILQNIGNVFTPKYCKIMEMFLHQNIAKYWKRFYAKILQNIGNVFTPKYCKMLEYFKRTLKVKYRSRCVRFLILLVVIQKLFRFISYLQTKEAAWKWGYSIFTKPEMLWSLLGQFWKVLINIKQLKSLIAVSLTPIN